MKTPFLQFNLSPSLLLRPRLSAQIWNCKNFCTHIRMKYHYYKISPFFCNPPQTNKKIFDLYFWFKSPHQFKRMNQMNHSLGVMCDGNGPFYFLDFSWKKPFGLFLFHIVSFSVTEGFLKYDKILLNRNLEGKTYPFAASKKLFWRRGDWHDCVKFKNPLCGLGSCIFWVWKCFHSLQVETMQIVLNYF